MIFFENLFFNYCSFLSEETALMLLKNLAFLSHVFTKVFPPLEPFLGVQQFLRHSFLPPLWKKVGAHV